MSNEQWKDISAYGDPWEVQTDIAADPKLNSSYRYRSAMFGRYRTEFEPGKPPTGAHAKTKDNQQ